MILFLLFSAGLVRLFKMRFEAGDLYPPYSSLRTDPLGSRALFESIDDLSEDRVSRNFGPLDRIENRNGSTLLIIGLTGDESRFREEGWQSLLKNISRTGGRLVISFVSREVMEKREDGKESETACPDETETSAPAGTDATTDAPDPGGNPEEAAPEALPVENPASEADAEEDLLNLGLSLDHESRDREELGYAAIREGGKPDDPLTAIFWRPGLFFQPDDPSWMVSYACNDNPVIMARSWGKAEIIMVADSYLFSNEALLDNRETRLLAQLVDPSGKVIFDEFHHGLVKSINTADLIRKYRLHSLVAAFVLIMILLIWRQATVMPVIRDEDIESDEDSESEIRQGWIQLVKQHILPRDMLSVCHQAWLDSEASTAVPETRKREIQKIVAEQCARALPGTKPERISSAYDKIHQLLKGNEA